VISDPDFKVTTFLKWNSVKTARIKDKVTIAQYELYLTYGMVLCLVTLADLQTRRAGLSAIFEFLVYIASACYACRTRNIVSLIPSVCLSDSLSANARIVSKRMDISSLF